jgi:hypothetical protein
MATKTRTRVTYQRMPSGAYLREVAHLIWLGVIVGFCAFPTLCGVVFLLWSYLTTAH